MTKVVLANPHRLDFVSTLVKTNMLESVEQITTDEEVVSVLPDESENLTVENNHETKVYIPSTLLTNDVINKSNVHVYFDLENYPFFQKAKEVIEEGPKSKGVFRFRRMVKQGEDPNILAGDLYVLFSLLGSVEDIKIKQTDQTITPAHTIIMINFSDGAMAHIEYTINDRERIELEWSGVKNIIEFDSDEMSPIQPIDQTKLPLLYTIDSILETAHKPDQSLIDQLQTFEEIVSGGVK